MGKLLVSGDSWTSCWPLEERLGHRRLGWPNLVSQHFCYDLQDKSRAGSSNYRIYRKSFNGMLEGVDLSLIFLTSWTRFETGATFGPKSGGIYQHQSYNKDSDQAFKLFFNGYLNYTDMIRQVISLQTLSKVQYTPCFFLDTFDNNLFRDISLVDFKDILKYNHSVFDNNDDARIQQKFRIVKQLESKIDWTKFISTQSYQSLIHDCKLEVAHPTEQGHAKIADIVINFLESRGYGKTI